MTNGLMWDVGAGHERFDLLAGLPRAGPAARSTCCVPDGLGDGLRSVPDGQRAS